MSKNKLMILSDIHIGSNVPTNWYQAKYHQPYLFAALDYAIGNADSFKEVIFLGDLVDFWTYPADKPVSKMENVVANNAALLGAGGKISRLLSALEGNVSYVHGNHDMVLTQADLDLIGHPGSYPVQLRPAVYYPLGEGNPDIVGTHGNIYSFSCAQDNDKGNPYAPLPLGYFITRSAAYFFEKKLKPGQTVADLPNVGVPSGWQFDEGFIRGIIEGILSGDFDVAELMLDALSTGSGLSEKQQIIMPGGSTTTIEQAKEVYKHAFLHSVEKHGLDFAYDSLVHVDFDNDLTGFSGDLAKLKSSKVVLMGHTHVPLERKMSVSHKGYVYANSGFNCPSMPDIEKGKKHPTFVEVEILSRGFSVCIRKVVKEGDNYRVDDDPAFPPVIIDK